MLTATVNEVVTVVGVEDAKDRQTGEVMCWGNDPSTPVRYLKFRAEGEQRYRRWLLEKGVDAPDEGTAVRLTFETRYEPAARNNRGTGEAFLTFQEKPPRIIRIDPADATRAAA